MEKNDNKSIILFDGVCNLCNGWVRFVVKRDKNLDFRFASFQSKPANDLMRKLKLSADQFDSIVLIEDTDYYLKSTAVLRIARKLDGLWPIFHFFIIVPPAWRDKVYDFVAAHRYNWFGRSDRCAIAGADSRDRFME
jgi:predicted DCC family thiol-disulfide oxidoreductase YuxK